jgi:hypothetical protein
LYWLFVLLREDAATRGACPKTGLPVHSAPNL